LISDLLYALAQIRIAILTKNCNPDFSYPAAENPLKTKDFPAVILSLKYGGTRNRPLSAPGLFVFMTPREKTGKNRIGLLAIRPAVWYVKIWMFMDIPLYFPAGAYAGE